MSDLYLTKNVLSGSSEYSLNVDTVNFEVNDSIFVAVDNDMIADDLMIIGLDPNIDVTLKLFLQYPTGAKLRINPSPAAGTQVTQAAPYQMNDDNDSRNMWFRVPKWTTLQIQFNTKTTDGALQVSLIGRG